jgi:hypothetical protein
MPPDECVRWLKEIVSASAAKRNSLLWQYAAAYNCQEYVHDEELMQDPFFRHVFTAVSERFAQVQEAAKTDERLAVALCKARAALQETNHFVQPNVVVDALECYWDLRHKLGRAPSDEEVLNEVGLRREPGYENYKRQRGRVLEAVHRVRGC